MRVFTFYSLPSVCVASHPRCPSLPRSSFHFHRQLAHLQLHSISTSRNKGSYPSYSIMTDNQVPQAVYRQLGKSGLRVSVPILGAMGIGDKRWQDWVIEEEEASTTYQYIYNETDSGTLTRPFLCSKQPTIAVSIPGTLPMSTATVDPKKS